jgi:hypothetical protein
MLINDGNTWKKSINKSDPEASVHYRYRETIYHITVLQTRAGKGGTRVIVDGVERDDQSIPLVDDLQEHSVEVRIRVAGDEKK